MVRGGLGRRRSTRGGLNGGWELEVVLTVAIAARGRGGLKRRRRSGPFAARSTVRVRGRRGAREDVPVAARAHRFGLALRFQSLQ